MYSDIRKPVKMQVNSTHISDLVQSLLSGLDSSCLPTMILEMYDKDTLEADIYLAKLAPALKYLPEFILSARLKTNKSVPISDVYDMYAFIAMNSDVKLKLSKEETEMVEIAKYKMRKITPSSSDKLLSEYEKVAEEITKDHLTIVNYITCLCNEPLQRIREFESKFKEKLEEPSAFIGEDLMATSIRIGDLLNRLSISDKYEVITDAWLSTNLANKPATYLLFVRMFYERPIHRSLYEKHPHLVALRGNPCEMAMLITKNFRDESDMRTAAAVFSNVSGISEGDLVTKCLICMQHLERGITNIAF